MKRTLYCLLGGPAAQAIFEKKIAIDLDEHISDGRKIDELFAGVALSRKSVLIEDATKEVFEFLLSPRTITARELIAQELISFHTLSSKRFLEIVKHHKVKRRQSQTILIFFLKSLKPVRAIFSRLKRALK
ncbi:hypothetical protein [Dyadobacter fanqingshengii]|uniref:Uncharacterized protein n=1 Tax=Dyadobacter fanqingshengii TaxID=2906443 RepID=A0A9X1P6L8_9BACT|nr:hypothetical protein [Dyadobacter fanqingshengii]MCF0039706.1 hypothetical protein [Dyadobacter fanqingshengii]USJ38531.1 hypothetical protein NFI81_12265 [Dyadobacter fanqingshengii]